MGWDGAGRIDDARSDTGGAERHGTHQRARRGRPHLLFDHGRTSAARVGLGVSSPAPAPAVVIVVIVSAAAGPRHDADEGAGSRAPLEVCAVDPAGAARGREG